MASEKIKQKAGYSPLSSETQSFLEEWIGGELGDESLYVRAITHRSLSRGASNEDRLSNERLEFLGDAILGSIVAERLFRSFPDKPEGFLTRLREKLVNGANLADVALSMGLTQHVRVSQGAKKSGVRSNPALLADAYEAILGAIYLDKGWDEAEAFVERTLLEDVQLSKLAASSNNFKSLLQEYLQARGTEQPVYETREVEGPPHKRIFTVEVQVEGESMGSGRAASKKDAEQEAAREALRDLTLNNSSEAHQEPSEG